MKKYLILVLYIINSNLAFAAAGSEHTKDTELLLKCQVLGHLVFGTCIVVTPSTIEQVAYCTVIYLSYNSCLRSLNKPLPMLKSMEPSPFAKNPYDICKYETANLAMYDLYPAIPFP